MRFNITSFVICLWILIGCTITKQRYSTGYHVEWHNRQPNNAANSPSVSLDLKGSEDLNKRTYGTESENITAFSESTNTSFFIRNETDQLEKREAENYHPKWQKESNSKSKISNYKHQNNKVLKAIGHTPPPIGRLHMRPSEEYLKYALAALLGGIFFVGLFVLSIFVFEFAELSIGAMIFTLFGVIGAMFILMVPICLLLALISFLIYG